MDPVTATAERAHATVERQTEKAHRTVDRTAHWAHQTVDGADGAAEQTSRRYHRLREQAHGQVQQHPWAILGVTAGMGAVLGWLARRPTPKP